MNTTAKTWEAVHTVIGFIKLNGLTSMTRAKVEEISKRYSADLEDVKSMAFTHYNIWGETRNAEYVNSL